MEALTSSSSSSSSSNLFNKNYRAFSNSRALFNSKPEFCFFPLQNGSKNVELSHSISQQFKSIHSISCSFSPFSSETEGGDVENAEALSQAKYESKTVHVKIQLQKECSFGQEFFLVGNDPIFGMWDTASAIPLDWSDGHVWSAELDIPIDKSIQFKFILRDVTGEVIWQPGPDRILSTWETEKTIVVFEDWENVEYQKITEEDPMANSSTEVGESMANSNTAESMPNPNIELIISKTAGLSVAAKMTYADEQSLVAENISYLKEEPTDADDAVTSIDSTVTDEKSTNTTDEECLFEYDGEPVLVPGLTPCPRTTDEEALPEVVETNGSTVHTPQDESNSSNANEVEESIPEKHKEEQSDENTHDSEEVTKGPVSDDEPKEEQPVTGLGEDMPSTNELEQLDIQSDENTQEDVTKGTVSDDDEPKEEQPVTGLGEDMPSTNELEQLDIQSDDVDTMKIDLQWGRRTLDKLLTILGFLKPTEL